MDNCIFCKIIAGKIPAQIVWQDDHVVAFRDINPHAPVHVLILPRKHVATFGELTAEDGPALVGMARAAREVARAEGVEKSGYRLLVNNGPDAHQEVMHVHMHLFGGRELGPMLKRPKTEG